MTACKPITVGELRNVLADVDGDLEVHVGVWGLKHFNEVLGAMPVTGVRKNRHAVLLSVKSLS